MEIPTAQLFHVANAVLKQAVDEYTSFIKTCHQIASHELYFSMRASKLDDILQAAQCAKDAAAKQVKDFPYES